jgi:hypothetical protein
MTLTMYLYMGIVFYIICYVAVCYAVLVLLYCKLGRFPHPHEFVLQTGFTENQ